MKLQENYLRTVCRKADVVVARVVTVAALPVAKSSVHYTMRTAFKYAGMFLVLCVVLAFFSRERFESSVPPERPLHLEPPYSYVLYTSD